jgi:hypothetical protein
MVLRTVVIAGGGRKVGKTELAEALAALLPDAAVVKLGVHHPRPEKNDLFFGGDTTWSEVRERIGARAFAVVESGAILDDPALQPDLVIFLPAPDGDKPGSERRRARADLVRGEPVDPERAGILRKRLDVGEDVMAAILRAVGCPVSPPSPR